MAKGHGLGRDDGKVFVGLRPTCEKTPGHRKVVPSTRKGRRGKRTPSFQKCLNLFVQWDASSTMEAPSRSQPHLVFGAEITLTFRIPQEDDKVLRSGCGAVELNLRGCKRFLPSSIRATSARGSKINSVTWKLQMQLFIT